jgi:hypothetical protein
MGRDYGALMDAASELESYGGYLTTDEKKAQLKAKQAFVSARDSFVYNALKDNDDAEETKSLISSDFEEMKTLQPGWESVFVFVQQELFERINKESKKSPLRRKIVKWTPAALAVVVAVMYFGVRFTSGIDVTQPLESKAGLVQRAAATEKVVSYDDFMGTQVRRGGFLKGILFWPIEPTQPEVTAASEFVSVTLEGYEVLQKQQEICGTLMAGVGNQLSQEQIEFVGEMAEQVQRPDLEWQTPPVMTILKPIKAKFPCQG